MKINWFIVRTEKIKKQEDLLHSVTIHKIDTKLYFDTGTKYCAMSRNAVNKLR